jgi:type II secretion system protein N
MNALRYAGYAAFFLVSLLLSVYLTFPWDAAKDRLLDFASRQAGAQITAESLEPSWITGFTATKVRYKTPAAEAPLEIDEVNARVKLLSLLTGDIGVTASLPLAKGTIAADVVSSDPELDVDATISSVELALVPGLQEAIGLPLGGKIDLDGKIHLDTKTPKNSEGEIKLKGAGLEILKGGKLSGFPIPELAIGDFSWTVPIKEGKATFDKQEVKGENVELKIDGDIVMLSPFDRSQLKLFISFKPTDAFLKKEPILNALLANINRAKGSDGFYTYAVNGTVKHPRFTPSRR